MQCISVMIVKLAVKVGCVRNVFSKQGIRGIVGLLLNKWRRSFGMFIHVRVGIMTKLVLKAHAHNIIRFLSILQFVICQGRQSKLSNLTLQAVLKC